LGVIEISKDVTGFRQMSHEILSLKGRANKADTARTKHVSGFASGKAASALTTVDHEKRKRSHYSFDDITGANARFLETLFIAKKAAENDHAVLISGETGTGKELFAQGIHYASARKKAPFLAQNCAALPESLLESILFGTAKGGFTGAVDRDGLFVQATGGTLLLDEISAMPYALQGKLLRVLQERYVRPVGGTADVPTNLRIISTINEPADTLIRTGRLRQDLYYRLNVIRIDVPPLRTRRDDISLLADLFLAKYSRMDGKNLRRLSKAAEEKLQAYDFPGNVRELENIMMAAVSLSGEEDILEADHIALPASMPDETASAQVFSESGLNLPTWLAQIEADILMEMVTRHGGNITRAASALGIKRQTLQHKLRKITSDSIA
jgi:arginine utilization regulatory protein